MTKIDNNTLSSSSALSSSCPPVGVASPRGGGSSPAAGAIGGGASPGTGGHGHDAAAAAVAAASINRPRHRSLRKSAAVEDESDPASMRHDLPLDTSSSGYGGLSSTVPRLLLPGPPDAASAGLPPAGGCCSAGLPSLQTPIDSNLLLVPSPASAYKLASPDTSRQSSTEIPCSSGDLALSSRLLSLFSGHTNGLAMLGQLAADKKLGDSGDTDDSSVSAAAAAAAAAASLASFAALSPNASFDAGLLTATSSSSSSAPKLEHLHNMHALSSSSSTELQLPNKSVIQDDVRNGSGRYQLVRKRGRSEVWNLFGQVVDTFTGQRLPYVACYACKVLYTDTGGGTGNMTRHRCPLGSSFRSLAGSSTDTLLHTSFDSVTSRRRSASPEAKKGAIAVSLPAQLSADDVCCSPPTGGSSSAPSGDSLLLLSEVDREAIAEAAIRCCALELIDPAVFASRGFRELAHHLLTVGRKSGGSSASSASSSYHNAEIFPDVTSMTQSIECNVRQIREDLRAEMAESDEVVLSVEKLQLDGLRFAVWLHRIRDWSVRRSMLAVYATEEVADEGGAIWRVLVDYGIPDQKRLRVVAPEGTPLPAAFTQAKLYADVVVLINTVVATVVESSSELHALLSSLDSLTSSTAPLDVLPFHSPDWPHLHFVARMHRMAAGWERHRATVRNALASLGHDSLVSRLNSIDWPLVSEAALFLEPFHDALHSLACSAPSLQRVVPEWEGLLHECEESTRWGAAAAAALRAAAARGALGADHRVAALLNPRLTRKLPMLFSLQHKEETLQRVRELCGLPEKASSSSSSSSPPSREVKTEPMEGGGGGGGRRKKRASFLTALEHEQSDDELEQFLAGHFHGDKSNLCRELLSFWSACSGRASAPRLASLARRLLAVPAAAPVSAIDRRVCSAASAHTANLLILRSAFQNQQ